MKLLRVGIALLFLFPCVLVGQTYSDWYKNAIIFGLKPGGGGGGSTTVTGTSPVVVSPISGGYNVSCPTCGGSLLSLQSYLTVSASQDIQVAKLNSVGGNASLTLTMPDMGPGTSDDLRGAVAKVSCINSPSGSGHVIQARAGGAIFLDDIPYSSLNPKTSNLSASRTFNLNFFFIAYVGGGYWISWFDAPFTGALNGTPLLGTIQGLSGETETWALDANGNLTKNGHIELLKGAFQSPASAIAKSKKKGTHK